MLVINFVLSQSVYMYTYIIYELFFFVYDSSKKSQNMNMWVSYQKAMKLEVFSCAFTEYIRHCIKTSNDIFFDEQELSDFSQCQ